MPPILTWAHVLNKKKGRLPLDMRAVASWVQSGQNYCELNTNYLSVVSPEVSLYFLAQVAAIPPHTIHQHQHTHSNIQKLISDTLAHDCSDFCRCCTLPGRTTLTSCTGTFDSTAKINWAGSDPSTVTSKLTRQKITDTGWTWAMRDCRLPLIAGQGETRLCRWPE